MKFKLLLVPKPFKQNKTSNSVGLGSRPSRGGVDMLGDEVIDYYVDNMVGVPNRADEKKGVKTTLTSAPMAS